MFITHAGKKIAVNAKKEKKRKEKSAEIITKPETCGSAEKYPI